ncbi:MULTISPECIES: hypothetical protein [Geobacillus]|uniref:hypothetical protein n=1 Tax=Geobacillus TaxID=129337 RepID=UPI000AD967DF|nr:MULTISPECIES: hypothetical protein [Geobacillus]
MPIMFPPISDDDALMLETYLTFAISQMGRPDSQTLCQFINFLQQKCREIEANRWRADPANWGACCPWPDDDFPF